MRVRANSCSVVSMKCSVSCGLAIVATLACGTPAFAQAPEPPASHTPADVSIVARIKTRITSTVHETIDVIKREPLVPAFMDDAKNLPSLETAAWLGAFGGLSLVSRPLDARTNQHLQGGFSDTFFGAGAALGENATLMGAGAGLYLWGRWKHESPVAHFGSDLLRGELESEVLTEGIKMAVSRPRPTGKGSSFPSGHASSAFTAATVIQRHHGWKAGVPAYAVASYVAASRLHDNVHYVSDVIFGAGIGIATGRAVTHRGNADYSLAPTVVRGGWALMVNRTAPPK